MFVDFDKGGPPSFKEMASFIRATQIFVEKLDQVQLSNLAGDEYLKSLVRSIVRQSRPKGADSSQIPKLVQSIWGRDEERRQEKLRSLLINHGLSDKASSEKIGLISDEAIQQFGAMTPKDVWRFAQ